MCCYRFISIVLPMVQGTYDMFFYRWIALPIDRLVGDETATFAMTEIHYYIYIAKYSNLVRLFQQRSFSSAQLLASFFAFGGHLKPKPIRFIALIWWNISFYSTLSLQKASKTQSSNPVSEISASRRNWNLGSLNFDSYLSADLTRANHY